MNYKIILDEQELNKFLDWLPENEDNQKYYITLFARKKYNPIVKSDKQCLKRLVTNKKDILNKLRQLEVKLGCYQIDNLEIPNDALAVYINSSVRDLKAASFNTINKLLQKIRNNEYINPYAVSMDEIQKAACKKFIVFDIDNKDNLQDFLDKKFDFLADIQYNVIETKGGLHLIIDLKSTKFTLNKLWYQKIISSFKVDQKGDLLSPIPGCIQGGFIPQFYSNTQYHHVGNIDWFGGDKAVL